MTSGFCRVVVFTVLTAFLAACAPITPTISEAERQELAEKATPYANDIGYTQALTRLGRMIAAIPDSNRELIRIQAKPIVNSSLSSQGMGEDVPLDITNMVITALNNLSSVERLLVIPYDPNYYVATKQTDIIVGAAQLTPNLILAGSITEFDKDVEATGTGFDADISDGGKAATDFGISANNRGKMSRVTLDLYLIDASINAVIPGLSVSNTVNVMEVEKGREVSFRIYGGGFGINGQISHTQGFQRAVRTLVGYSVVQLLGRFYELSYEPLLGMTEKDPLIKRHAHTQQKEAVTATPPPAVQSPQPVVQSPQPVAQSQQPAAQQTAVHKPQSKARPTSKTGLVRSTKPAALPEDLDSRMEGLL